MDKTNDIHLEKLFETKEIIPNSFLTTIEEEMLVLQNKISELEKKNLNLLIQNSASQKFKDEISKVAGIKEISYESVDGGELIELDGFKARVVIG